MAQPGGRPPAVVALLVVLVATAGCGSSAATTGAPSAAPTPLVTPPLVTPSATPGPSALTAGFGTADEAIRAWLEIQGLDYSGDCETGTREEGTYCSALYTTVTAGRIYVSGPIDSETAYWILVTQIDGRWYVLDAATFSETSAPPTGWH